MLDFCDNQSDCYSFLRGTNGNAGTASVIAAITAEIEAMQSDTWFCWISTHRNPADLPSRPSKMPEFLRAYPDAVEIPADESDIDWAAFKRHHAELQKCGQGAAEERRAEKARGAPPAKRRKKVSA
jgi:hypothetical protein